MPIVPQFASFSYSSCLLLPAPKIAGLLPANVPSSNVILRLADPQPVRDFPTPEELDFEIGMTFLRILQRSVPA